MVSTETKAETNGKAKAMELFDGKTFSLVPRDLDEAMRFAKLMSESDLAPKDFKGKPGNVLVAVQMGIELGIPPMQAIQGIAVINGRPCVWGDLFIGVVRNFPICEYIHEDDFETIKKTGKASCRTKRKGDPKEHVATFSIDDAKTAGLWGKAGPWTNYPYRMLQNRARFVLRDVFADRLKGLVLREEMEDYRDTAVEAETVPMPQRATETAPAAPTLAPVPETEPAQETQAEQRPQETEEVSIAHVDRTHMKVIEARWPGKCSECQGGFDKGTMICYDAATKNGYHRNPNDCEYSPE